MEHDFAKEMGVRLKAIRDDLGLKQVPFAEALEISQSAYNSYERGQRELPTSVLCRLLTKFRVDPTWMLFGKGDRYRVDPLDRFFHTEMIVTSYFTRRDLALPQDKKRRLMDFLIGYGNEHGEMSAESIDKYLQSVI
jgi:transcriptional regulator with XRE-family HTH domain